MYTRHIMSHWKR